MKENSNKQLKQLPAPDESSSLRMVYKNEEVIHERSNAAGKEEATRKSKGFNKLFVKEPLPLFNDYKFKAKDHDPL
jgi:predicted Holliday junction resolvase-like endonuclease